MTRQQKRYAARKGKQSADAERHQTTWLGKTGDFSDSANWSNGIPGPSSVVNLPKAQHYFSIDDIQGTLYQVNMLGGLILAGRPQVTVHLK